MIPKISAYPVQVAYPVHWGDMDAVRHVNNLIYLIVSYDYSDRKKVNLPEEWVAAIRRIEG